MKKIMKEKLKSMRKVIVIMLVLVANSLIGYSQVIPYGTITPIPKPFIPTQEILQGERVVDSSGKSYIRGGFVSIEDNRKYWYNPTRSVYQVKYPVLRYMPPVTEDMPTEVKSAYFWLDSMARNSYKNKHIAGVIDNYSIGQRIRKDWEWKFNDTLKRLIKEVYIAMNYDPGLFRQYTFNTRLRHVNNKFGAEQKAAGDTVMFYKSGLEFIELAFSPIYYDEMCKSKADRFSDIDYTDFILKIKVLSVTPIPKGADSNYTPPYFSLKVLVTDKLKGQKLPQLQTNSDSTILNLICSSRSYIDRETGKQKIDPEFVDEHNELSFKAGQEGIIFCKLDERTTSLDSNYFDLRMATESSNAIYPILNGKVRDIKKIWSDELLLDYADWKSKFKEVETKIINGNY